MEEEEQEVDVTTVTTSTSREEVRCVELGGALASWPFAAFCSTLLTHVASRVRGQPVCCPSDPEEISDPPEWDKWPERETLMSFSITVKEKSTMFHLSSGGRRRS